MGDSRSTVGNKRRREDTSDAGDAVDANTYQLPGILLVKDPSYNLPRHPDLNLSELYIHFNKNYFEGKLEEVNVKWNHELYSTKGIFLYTEEIDEACEIQLSSPRLTLNWQIYFTLLHEMIHACVYFSVTDDLRESLKRRKTSYFELSKDESLIQEAYDNETERRKRVEAYREMLVADHHQPAFQSHLTRIKLLSGVSLPQRASSNISESTSSSSDSSSSSNSGLPTPTSFIVHKLDKCFSLPEAAILLEGA